MLRALKMVIARKFVVSGMVQGVGYRFFAQRVAARHQVRGYVKNLPDGCVEVYTEGPPDNVEEFKHDLATGPEFSHIEKVEELVLEPQGRYSTFRIER
jgi:acylphosphatase